MSLSTIAPAATSRAVIARLHGVAQGAQRQPDIREKLLGVGVEVVEATTIQFGEKINAELAKWDKVVKPLGITPE